MQNRYHAIVDDTGQLIVSPVGRDYLDTKGQDKMLMMCLFALGEGLNVLLAGKYEDDELSYEVTSFHTDHVDFFCDGRLAFMDGIPPEHPEYVEPENAMMLGKRDHYGCACPSAYDMCCINTDSKLCRVINIP